MWVALHGRWEWLQVILLEPKLTARLRQEGQLTKTEAERLVSFTNSSNPLFIFGAVSVGFFHNAKLGIILAFAHYLGNISVGLIMRFHGKKEPKKRECTIENIQLEQPFLLFIKQELRTIVQSEKYLVMLSCLRTNLVNDWWIYYLVLSY